MKISQLIRLLEHYKKIYGDLPCNIYMGNINNANLGVDTINCVKEIYNENHHIESICIMHKNIEEE